MLGTNNCSFIKTLHFVEDGDGIESSLKCLKIKIMTYNTKCLKYTINQFLILLEKNDEYLYLV